MERLSFYRTEGRRRRRSIEEDPLRKMDCRPRWDLSNLIGAYVSLAIAFLLLCCSTLTFFADKFLALFGLRLPYCPHFNAFLLQAPPSFIATLPWHTPPFAHDALLLLDRDAPENNPPLLEGEKDEGEKDEGEEKPEDEEQLDWDTKRGGGGRMFGDDEDPWNAGISGDHSDGKQVLDGTEGENMRVLKQALQKERASRSALYSDLEKERSYASSAADEAIAMILRLQKEKATIEMNAKQYQRMIEEKAAYDEDEMEILKEIVVTREKELYFLGKQVGIVDDHSSADEEEYLDFQEKGVVSVDVYAPHVQQQQQQQPCSDVSNLSRQQLVDGEKNRLEKEIENLRQKLMVVQQGRDKLNSSVDHQQMEEDGFQSELLQEIGLQLQFIRRRSSSPTSPSKFFNMKRKQKKRRHGTSSLGVNGSN